MRKHGGFHKHRRLGTPVASAWFAKDRARRRRRNKIAKKSRKENRRK